MSFDYPNIFVSDFDGTLTQVDFFQAVLSEIVKDDLSIWQDYTLGRISHFDALAGYYRKIHWTENQLIDLVHRLGFPNDFSGIIDRLGQGGWSVVIASAGCEWYIRKLMEKAGTIDRVAIHSNHGTFVEGKGLVMELPKISPFFDPFIGISKENVVKHWIEKGKLVAFAGDGPTDLKASLLVPGERRFARGALASTLKTMNEPFQEFRDWSEISKVLLKKKS